MRPLGLRPTGSRMAHYRPLTRRQVRRWRPAEYDEAKTGRAMEKRLVPTPAEARREAEDAQGDRFLVEAGFTPWRDPDGFLEAG